MEEIINISYRDEEGFLKEYELNLIESKDYDHYTVWETRGYPSFRITQEDFHYFKTGEDIEILTGDLDNNDKEKIAYLFNEHIDTILNRPIKVDVVIRQEEGDIPFEYGHLHVSTYYLEGAKFIKKSSFSVLMNNHIGYIPVKYMVDKESNDRYAKIDNIEIGYKIPKGEDRDQKYFIGEVFYLDHKNDGVVHAISADNFRPRVDIRVSFLQDILLYGIEIKGEIFHGVITEYFE